MVKTRKSRAWHAYDAIGTEVGFGVARSVELAQRQAEAAIHNRTCAFCGVRLLGRLLVCSARCAQRLS